MSINPQGYEYGKEPVNKNPFWDDVDIFDQYVKDIQLTVDEGTENNSFKLAYTNQDNEVIELPVEVLYMTPEQIKNKLPSEYVKTIGLAVTEGTDHNTAELSFKNQDDVTVGVAPIITYMTPEQVKDLIGQDIPIEYIKSMNIYATDLEDGTRGFNLHIEYTPNGHDEPTAMDFHLMTNTDIINAINQAKNEVHGEIPTEYIKDLEVEKTEQTNIQANYTKIDFYKTPNNEEQTLMNTVNIYTKEQTPQAVYVAMGNNKNINSISVTDDAEVIVEGQLTESTKRFSNRKWNNLGKLTSPIEIASINYAKPENIVSYIDTKLGSFSLPYPYTKSVGGFSYSADNNLTENISINYTSQQSKSGSTVVDVFSWTNYTKEGIQDLINKTINGRVAQIQTKTSTTTRESGLKETKLQIRVYEYVEGKPSLGFTPINISYVTPEDLEVYVNSKLGGA